MAHVSIHWFRKGLRLHDNPALGSALRGSQRLYPLFILEPSVHNQERMGVNPWRFLLEALQDLDGSLRKLNLR